MVKFFLRLFRAFLIFAIHVSDLGVKALAVGAAGDFGSNGDYCNTLDESH